MDRQRITSRVMEELVWPAFRQHFPLAQIVDLQSEASSFAHHLDTNSGIDALITINRSNLLLAHRVEDSGRCYSNFTIRSHTIAGQECEWFTLERALRTGATMPRVHIHAYVTPDHSQLVAAAMCETRTLVEISQRVGANTKTNPEDGTTFRRVPWSAFAADQIYVIGAGAPASMRREVPTATPFTEEPLWR